MLYTFKSVLIRNYCNSAQKKLCQEKINIQINIIMQVCKASSYLVCIFYSWYTIYTIYNILRPQQKSYFIGYTCLCGLANTKLILFLQTQHHWYFIQNQENYIYITKQHKINYYWNYCTFWLQFILCFSKLKKKIFLNTAIMGT